MSKFRNAAAVIILCIIAGLGYRKYMGSHLNLPSDQDQLKDTVAANPASRHNHLNLAGDDQGELKDSLAEGPAIPTGNGFNGGNHFDNGNFHGSNQPTRGNTDGSINPGNRYDYVPPHQNNTPSNISPSGPQQPTAR